MRFASIYESSYSFENKATFKLRGKLCLVLAIVLALHYLAIYLLYINPIFSRPQNNFEIVIDLSPLVVIADRVVGINRDEGLEKKQININTPKPVELKPEVVESVPPAKLNEQAVKLVDVEKIEEKKAPVNIVEKVEMKKIQPQAQVQQEDAVSTALPVVVDKKNKDKDAPVVTPANNGSTSPALASTPEKSEGARSTASQPAALAPQLTGKTVSSGSEMQAQMNAKPVAQNISGGNSAVAEADYRSSVLKNPPPSYPIYARRMRQQGTVILAVDVLPDGSTGDVKIASSSGIQLLDQAALETIKQWRFKPPQKDGTSYAQRLRIPINFSLDNR
jgi:protein TonB